jgi:hypothetical protein
MTGVPASTKVATSELENEPCNTQQIDVFICSRAWNAAKHQPPLTQLYISEQIKPRFGSF